MSLPSLTLLIYILLLEGTASTAHYLLYCRLSTWLNQTWCCTTYKDCRLGYDLRKLQGAPLQFNLYIGAGHCLNIPLSLHTVNTLRGIVLVGNKEEIKSKDWGVWRIDNSEPIKNVFFRINIFRDKRTYWLSFQSRKSLREKK